jgi:hypothetical protein
MSGRKIPNLLSEEALFAYDNVILCHAAVPSMNIRPMQEFIMVTWPPASRADDVGDFVKFLKGFKCFSNGDRRVSSIGVLLSFDAHHQASVLKEYDSSVMARVMREDLHVASGLHF